MPTIVRCNCVSQVSPYFSCFGYGGNVRCATSFLSSCLHWTRLWSWDRWQWRGTNVMLSAITRSRQLRYALFNRRARLGVSGARAIMELGSLAWEAGFRIKPRAPDTPKRARLLNRAYLSPKQEKYGETWDTQLHRTSFLVLSIQAAV
jgi:hypothetical protein